MSVGEKWQQITQLSKYLFGARTQSTQFNRLPVDFYDVQRFFNFFSRF